MKDYKDYADMKFCRDVLKKIPTIDLIEELKTRTDEVEHEYATYMDMDKVIVLTIDLGLVED